LEDALDLSSDRILKDDDEKVRLILILKEIPTEMVKPAFYWVDLWLVFLLIS